jgi:hypothetical protein
LRDLRIANGYLGPLRSALITISAITFFAVASATLGIYVPLILMPIYTIDNIVFRSAFYRTLNTRAFKYMAYALSAVESTAAVQHAPS